MSPISLAKALVSEKESPVHEAPSVPEPTMEDVRLAPPVQLDSSGALKQPSCAPTFFFLRCVSTLLLYIYILCLSEITMMMMMMMMMMMI